MVKLINKIIILNVIISIILYITSDNIAFILLNLSVGIIAIGYIFYRQIQWFVAKNLISKIFNYEMQLREMNNSFPQNNAIKNLITILQKDCMEAHELIIKNKIMKAIKTENYILQNIKLLKKLVF